MGFSRVKAPVDLGIINERVQGNYYTSMDSFRDDINTIVSAVTKTQVIDDPMNIQVKAKKLNDIVTEYLAQMRATCDPVLIQVTETFAARMAMRKAIEIIRNSMIEKGAIYLLTLVNEAHMETKFYAIRGLANLSVTGNRKRIERAAGEIFNQPHLPI